MSDQEQKQRLGHDEPCDPLKSFRRIITGVIGAQGLFVIVCLTMTLNVMGKFSDLAEKQIAIMERQKNIESKADGAVNKSTEALALSGKAEANMQWVREGLTEVKSQLRDMAAYKTSKQ